MKNSKLEKLNIMLSLYNKELYTLKDEKRKIEVEIEDKQKEHKTENDKSIKIVYGATIPTMLGLLGVILFPCIMSFSIPSFIIAGCIGILATYLAAPNYKKWVKNIKICDALTDKIKALQSKLEDNKAKVEIVENKIETINKLVSSYNSKPTATAKTQTTSKNNITSKNVGIER